MHVQNHIKKVLLYVQSGGVLRRVDWLLFAIFQKQLNTEQCP